MSHYCKYENEFNLTGSEITNDNVKFTISSNFHSVLLLITDGPFHCLNDAFLHPNSDSKEHGAHLGPVGPRSAPCRPHEPCYQGRTLGGIS